MRNTLRVDKNTVREDALFDIYRVMRPGEPPTVEAAEAMFKQPVLRLASATTCRSVGRVKMNMRLELDCPDDVRVLRKEDVLAVLQDPGRPARRPRRNRRHRQPRQPPGPLGRRAAGEPVPRRPAAHGARDQGAHELGRYRHGHAARPDQRQAGGGGGARVLRLLAALAVHGPDQPAVGDHPQAPPLGAWPGRSDPRARRLRSPRRAPDPLRPDLPDRDAGRPEHRPDQLAGHPRAWSTSTASSRARTGGSRTARPTDEVVYMSAMEEAKHVIAQANIKLDERRDRRRPGPRPDQRRADACCRATSVDLMDVSPKQVVSVAAALIPFLENDDANRALMGSNMQTPGRAAHPVGRAAGRHRHGRRRGPWTPAPSWSPAAPAWSSRSTAPGSSSAPRKRPTRPSRASTSTACRSSSAPTSSTCINQRPLVRVGDRIEAGDIIADGPSTELGELALGRNALVAFMPWNGYNFEDSILISERIVRDDVFTSIHIEEFEVMARDTKLGPEEITRDIPNVGEEALRNLDEAGIVAIGAEVLPGDILVGKVTPKGESPMTPEEKLLRAIFGEKASDVRDTSLRLPPGRRRHDRRSAGVQPARRRQGRTRPGHRTRGDRPPGQGPRRRVRHPEPQHDRPPARAAGRQDRRLGSQGPGPRRDHRRQAGGDRARPVVADRARRREGDGRAGGHAPPVRRGPQAPRPPLRGQGRQAAARRRAAARRDEDGQGVRGGEAQAAAGRQDGRPSRQQGRHLQDPADRGHAVPGRRHRRRHRAEPAGRAFAHERRPDLRDPPRAGPPRASASRSPTCWKPGRTAASARR